MYKDEIMEKKAKIYLLYEEYSLECFTIFSNIPKHNQTEAAVLLLFQYPKSKISDNLD